MEPNTILLSYILVCLERLHDLLYIIVTYSKYYSILYSHLKPKNTIKFGVRVWVMRKEKNQTFDYLGKNLTKNEYHSYRLQNMLNPMTKMCFFNRKTWSFFKKSQSVLWHRTILFECVCGLWQSVPHLNHI